MHDLPRVEGFFELSRGNSSAAACVEVNPRRNADQRREADIYCELSVAYTMIGAIAKRALDENAPFESAPKSGF